MITLQEYLPVFTLIIGALSAYFGAQMALRVELARLETQVKALTEKVDSDHAKLDQLERAVYSRGVNHNAD